MRPQQMIDLAVLWMKYWSNGRTFYWKSDADNARVLDSMFTRLSLSTSRAQGRQIAFDAYQKAYDTGALILVPRTVFNPSNLPVGEENFRGKEDIEADDEV